MSEIIVGDIDLVGMFGDDLEFVVGGNVDRLAHGPVDDFAERFAEFNGLSPDKIDANEWHGVVLLRRKIGRRRR
jgi:hypothetical protein